MSEVIIAVITSSTIQLLILLVAIIHFNKSHKINQTQFETKITQTNNIETVKQLSYFDDGLIQIYSDFNKSRRLVKNCMDCANKWVLLLDRLCFLYDKGKVDEDFLEYFTLRIDMGKRFVNWLQLMNRNENVQVAFPYFLKYYSKFNFQLEVDIDKPFIFFLYKYKNMREYDTELDDVNSSAWVIPTNYRNSQYYKLLHRDPLELINAVNERPETIFEIS